MKPLKGGEVQAGPAPGEPQEWTLKPVVGQQVIMSGIGALLIGLGGWFAAGAFRAQKIEVIMVVFALTLASMGGFLIATALTTRLVLTQEHLAVWALWRTQWSLARRRVEIREGTAGPNRPSPGLAIIDIESGKVVRQIPTGQFPASDMRRLAQIFAPPL